MSLSPDKTSQDLDDQQPPQQQPSPRTKMSKHEADEHRRLLEEKLLGIKSERSPLLATTMSNMAMVMAGASEVVDPLQDVEERGGRQKISRTQSLPASAL